VEELKATKSWIALRGAELAMGKVPPQTITGFLDDRIAQLGGTDGN
jgi:hypothetical protein